MKILQFIEQFYLHDSSIENIGNDFFKDQLVMTVNLCNWAQKTYRPGIDPDHYIGNCVFKNVTMIAKDPADFVFQSNQILEVNYEVFSGDLVKVNFYLMLLANTSPDKGNPIVALSITATDVEWVAFETYNDQ